MSSFKSNLSSRKAIMSAVSFAALAATSSASWADASLDSRVTVVRADRNASSVNSAQTAGSGELQATGEISPGTNEGTTANRGGSGDAINNWTNAAGGPWATGSNWSLAAAPSAADDAIFNLNSTYGVSLPTGATANTLQIRQGVVNLTGGSLTLSRVGAASGTDIDPGVGAPPVAGNNPTSLAVGFVNGQTGRLNIAGGTLLNYTQAYVGGNPTAVGILDVSGAGTIVAPTAATAAANGRFGIVAGSGTINVRDGAQVTARLFEFGRQDGTAGGRFTANVNVTNGGKIDLAAAGGQIVMPRGAFTDAVLTIDGAGSYVHGAAIFSGASTSTSILNVSNGADLTGTQFTVGSGDGASSIVNMSNGATATYDTGFTGGSTIAGNPTYNLSGANTRFRINNVLVTNGGGAAGANVGVSTINVTSGAKMSVGRLNGNQDGGSLGTEAATKTVINVNGAGSIFEVSNSTGFDNSYLVLGQGANSTGEINVTNGGTIDISDTDGVGSSFTAISSFTNTRSLVNVTGGSTFNAGNSLAIGDDRSSLATVNVANSTMNYNSQLTIASSVYAADGSTGAASTVSLTAGGKIITNPAATAAGNAFIALDRDDVANITVSGTGSELSATGGLSLGGGNVGDDGDFTAGGGTTNITINSGGVVKGTSAFIARDAGVDAASGAKTTINVDGVGSVFAAAGLDNPATADIDSGIITSGVLALDTFDFEIPGSGDATFAVVNINVTNGGLFDAAEAYFMGDTANGSTTVTVAGAGSVVDAGRQLTVNSDGLAASLVTINLNNGGVLRTSASAGNAAITSGSMFINTDAGTGTASINLTGTGSKLESSASILLGGVFDENNLETLGTTVNVNAGAGTSIVAAGSLDLGSTSVMNTAGTVSVLGVSTIGGTWTASAGAPSAGTLNVVGAGLVKLTNPTAASATLLKTDNTLIAATAKVDIGKNAMRIRPEGVTVDDTSLADVKTFLALGRVGPGTGGITSTALTANMAIGYKLVTTAGTFLGDTTAVGDILVRSTLKGDTDLNGAVSFDDLLTLAQAYNTVGTGEWYTGDSTFDGNVNFDDLLALAQNYGTNLITGTTGETVTGSFAGDWTLALSMVPEPTSIAALGMGAALLGRRRSR